MENQQNATSNSPLLEHQNKRDATSLVNMRKLLLTATPRNHHLMQHQTFMKCNMLVLLQQSEQPSTEKSKIIVET